MKTLLALTLLFILVVGCLHADTVLNDNGTITKDGVSLNNASDALLNRQITSAEFMTTLQAKLAASSAAVTAAQADASTLQTAMQTRLATDLSNLQAALNAATDPTQRAVLAAQIALVQAYQAAAGQTPDQLRAAALAAEIAAKQAELAKIQAN